LGRESLAAQWPETANKVLEKGRAQWTSATQVSMADGEMKKRVCKGRKKRTEKIS
jgi:hypothetical protein